MAAYRKRPFEIEAFRLGHDEPPYWALSASVSSPERFDPYIDLRDGWDYIHVSTPEGPMAAYKGDWLIQGIHGELYPCKHDIFTETYDPVNADGSRFPLPPHANGFYR